MNKRRLCLLLCAVLLLLCLGGCGGCSRAPELEEIYDRTVELVEGSRRMSVIFYGAGLPVYDRQSAIYRDLYDSDTSAYRTQYSIVDPRCGYVSVDALKAAARVSAGRAVSPPRASRRTATASTAWTGSRTAHRAS